VHHLRQHTCHFMCTSSGAWRACSWHDRCTDSTNVHMKSSDMEHPLCSNVADVSQRKLEILILNLTWAAMLDSASASGRVGYASTTNRALWMGLSTRFMTR